MRFGRAKKPVGKITRAEHRARLHAHVRLRVRGTAERPRLAVFRSHQHIYAQVIDDASGRTLAAASSLDKTVRAAARPGGNITAAKAVGTALGASALRAGLTQVVFDRGGYKYHGRVKALAEAAREAGLKF